MDYIGRPVFHKAKYGKGTIVFQDDKGHIKVQFDSEKSEKTFLMPACFSKHLELCDGEQGPTSGEKTPEKRKRNHEALLKGLLQVSGQKEKDDPVPVFSSVEAFYTEQERVLYAEIAYLRENGGRRKKLFDGRFVEYMNNHYIYSFESDSELYLPDQTQISLWLPEANEAIPAVVVNCEDFTVIIAVKKNLGDYMPMIEFSSEPWQLIRYLIDRLNKMREHSSPIVKAIICDGHKKIQENTPIAKGQHTACQMSLSQPITFIWGPPGTGKTETLAEIALQHLSKGYRVLMLSYSNVSVDGAIWRVFKKDTNKKVGKLVRYGYPRDHELLQHEYLTSYNLTLKNHPALAEESIRLTEERKKLPRTSSRYVEIGRRLTEIKKKLEWEEKKAVLGANFVATTVSKAIADNIIFNDKYDTVIFDEASMAYISQIVFSAGLAQKHFICMGDFAQLPPIVQGDGSKSLNADIFKYCGIVDAVESGDSHEWLCMLDTQYRMHPDIALFPSLTMYKGLLKSGSDMAEKRESIVRGKPFSGEAFQLVDLSGMMSVCTKTSDNSRINVLSALMAMGLAVNAAHNHEVGIITPYNAQSRLLHAMARDVAEQDPTLKTINCATVHQFQGSERDTIIYDAVDCYRMQYPGALISSTANNYANRLYNVAVTRARGKMVSVVNMDYMKTKSLSKSLIFRTMMDWLSLGERVSKGVEGINEASSDILTSFTQHFGEESFIKDIEASSKLINIDIPGGTNASASWLARFANALSDAKKRNVKIVIRTNNEVGIPKAIRSYAIENKFITNPIAIIDKNIIWYGMPASTDEFVAEGENIPTQYRPIFRLLGKHTAQSLYGFLEMNRTEGRSLAIEEEGPYSSFAEYVSGEIKCIECDGKMRLKKNKRGKFFLGCVNYPRCQSIQSISPDIVESYFYYKNRKGKHCPHDHTSLEARMGRYGLYVCCCGFERHYFKLDEI